MQTVKQDGCLTKYYNIKLKYSYVHLHTHTLILKQNKKIYIFISKNKQANTKLTATTIDEASYSRKLKPRPTAYYQLLGSQKLKKNCIQKIQQKKKNKPPCIIVTVVY